MRKTPLIGTEISAIYLSCTCFKVCPCVKAPLRNYFCQIAVYTWMNMSTPSCSIVPLHVVHNQLTATCIDFLSSAIPNPRNWKGLLTYGSRYVAWLKCQNQRIVFGWFQEDIFWNCNLVTWHLTGWKKTLRSLTRPESFTVRSTTAIAISPLKEPVQLDEVCCTLNNIDSWSVIAIERTKPYDKATLVIFWKVLNSVVIGLNLTPVLEVSKWNSWANEAPRQLHSTGCSG